MLEFSTQHDVEYGVTEQVSPLIKRITANNPGKFTFKGTGTYIVGRDSVAVIDPGPDNNAHIDALSKELEGKEVTHILITHTHRDHCPAVPALKERVGGLVCGFGPHPKEDAPPIEKSQSKEKDEDANEDSEESGDLNFMPEKFLGNGDTLIGKDWTIESLYTPGHISNHLCFAFHEEKAIFTGDHIMGWSTTIIPPPDGNLEDYFLSLELLAGRDEEIYYPTHGGAITNPKEFVKELIEHRKNRNNQILDCLQTADNKEMTIPEIVSIIYKDYPEELHKPAQKSVLAHLIYLQQKKLITCEGQPRADSKFGI